MGGLASLALTEPLALLQVDAPECAGQPVAGAGVDRILQPREGRLAGQVGSTLRSAAADPLEQRITAQRVGVILVFVAAADLEDSLAHQRHQRVLDGPAPPVRDRAGQRGAQSQGGIRLSDPGQATIRGQATGVKRNVLRSGGKQSRRTLPCAKLGHEVSPGTLEWE